MTDSASTLRSTATSTSTTEQIKDQVRDKAQAAQDKAKGALGQARGRLRDQVDQRSTQAGDQIHSTAQDVRSLAEQLRGQGKDTPARLAEQVAERAESFGGYLRNADGDRLLHDVETFARRQPWLVAVGGLALGFAASRVLKASSSRRYQGGYDRSSVGEHLGGTTAISSTSDPTWTGFDHGAEAPDVPADEAPSVMAPTIPTRIPCRQPPRPLRTATAPASTLIRWPEAWR